MAFSNVAEKRAHEMAANRAVSLDITSKASPLNTSNNGTPVHRSEDTLATAAAVSMISARSKDSPIKNYFRPAHSQINFGRLAFLITHSPTDTTIENYISDLERYKAKYLVRVSEPTYSMEPIKEHGITVHDWQFEDGGWPPIEIIQKFLQLCLDVFTGTDDCIAIHCVAGLGRAPMLVCLALIEAGLKCDDAVFLIRSNRRGALNDKQLEFLQQYRPTGRLRKLRYAETKQRKSCAIM